MFFTAAIGLYIGTATLIGLARFRKELVMMIPLILGTILGFCFPIFILSPKNDLLAAYLCSLSLVLVLVSLLCKKRGLKRVTVAFAAPFALSALFGFALLFLAFIYWLVGGPGLL